MNLNRRLRRLDLVGAAGLRLQQDPLQAVFTGPRDAVLAWSSDRAIYVENLSLQDGDP